MIINMRLFILSLVLLLTACESNKVYEESIEVKGGEWERKEVAKFEFEIKDSTQQYNLFVNLRNSGDYPYRNLYLFITLESPTGKYAKDTLECVLADKTGRWLGKGFGDVWSHKVLYKKGVLFRKKGKFKVRIEQAMRKEKLPAILDVGFTVERMENIPEQSALNKGQE